MTATLLPLHEGFHWHPVLTIDKFSPQLMREALGDLPELRELERLEKSHLIAAGVTPDGFTEVDGNLLTTAGITRMLGLLIGNGTQAMNNTHARIGVGNGSTAATAADSDLAASAGSTNRWFNMADASNPSVATNVLTCVSTFASADGNFVWAEWGMDFGTASGNTVTAPLLNRKVQAMGTKASGAVWTATATVTVTSP